MLFYDSTKISLGIESVLFSAHNYRPIINLALFDKKLKFRKHLLKTFISDPRRPTPPLAGGCCIKTFYVVVGRKCKILFCSKIRMEKLFFFSSLRIVVVKSELKIKMK